MASTLPFHRKYRPSSISEYVGNEKIVTSIMAALRSDSKPQAILMEGNAGCGKTSMARLLAMEYLCENRDEIHGACGECYNCNAMKDYIETGDTAILMNVREVDAADSNKRQDVDDLLEDAKIPAYDGSWKIYIFDECHMMSPAAQNRLLKSLEEPTERVLMILCTTDPEKLLGTILSRCQYRYRVKKPDRNTLGNFLGKICKKEGVEFDLRGLSLVCVKGEFTFRNALIKLEQVIKERNRVCYDDVVEVLSIIEDTLFFDFFDILFVDKVDIYRYVYLIGKIKETTELKTFVDNLIAFTMRGIYVANKVIVEALDKSEVEQYKKLFSKIPIDSIVNFLKLLLDMKNSQDIEAKLLLMGYTGVVRQITSNADNVVPDVLSTRDIDVTPDAERNVGSKNFNESMKITEDEKKEIVESQTAKMSMSDLLNAMGGSLVINE